MKKYALVVLVATLAVSGSAPLVAQRPAQNRTAGAPAKPAAKPAADAALPPGYVIGPEDVLTVVFWREAEMSGEVVVRPDGMISLPLLQDVQAAGLTPEQLAQRLVEHAAKYLEAPSATVSVKQLNSRKVFITGNVGKPGAYVLTAPTTVLQLIAIAGGLAEYADQKNISIVRNEGGKSVSLRFNYKDVSNRKKLEQNILLNPGDTVVVP